MIVGFDDDADPDGAIFEACASRVTTSLTALSHEAPTTEVRVFVLTKPDGFRTKVLHSGRYSVKRLLDSAEEWKTACRNLPSLRIRKFGEKKGDKPFWIDPFIPYPAGAIFHIQSKRRREVLFTPVLRGKTEDAALRLHDLVARGVTPPPVLKPRCRGCSLRELCLPELLPQKARLQEYQRNLYRVE